MAPCCQVIRFRRHLASPLAAQSPDSAALSPSSLAERAHAKLEAAFGSPEPLYFGHDGHSHTGRVRPRVAVFWSVVTRPDGACPFSTQPSRAASGSHPAKKPPPAVRGLAKQCPRT